MPARNLTSILLLSVVSLFAASCGVSRSTEAAVDVSTPAETTTTTSPAPASTAPAGDVAVAARFGDGSEFEVLHGELNDVVVPTRDNADFVGLIYGGQMPPGFDAVVLSQTVIGRVLDAELAKVDRSPSEAEQTEARDLLFSDLQQFVVGVDDPTEALEALYAEVPYLPFIVDLQARQLALSSALAEGADPSITGDPCVRHILLESEEEANEVLVELDGGADFATLAQERSVGPTGPNGGDLGCAPAANYVEPFAEAVLAAETGQYVGPVQTQFGWHVILVEGVEVNGDLLVQEVLTTSLSEADITVDERLGTWDPISLSIVPAP